MKRIFCLSLVLALLLCACAFPVSAADVEPMVPVASYVTHFDDGSYCVTTILQTPVEENGAARAYKLTSGQKASAYYASGVLQFTTYVKGTFKYNGSTAMATTAQYSYSIANSAWSFSSGSAHCSGATAYATCTFYNSLNGNKSVTASLTCSPTGKLS